MTENSFFNFDSPVVRVDKKSYDKGIDEFAESLLSQKIIDKSVVRRIAEQLKEGV